MAAWSRSSPALALLAALARPAAGEAVAHAQVGVPLPLALYGARGDGGAVALLAHGQLGAAARLGASRFFLGGAAGLSYLEAGNRLGSHAALWSAGPELSVRARLRGATLTVGGGPSVARIAVTVDDRIGKRSHALGGRAQVRLERALAGVGVGLAVGLELYGAPVDDAAWFNRRLGGTRLVTVGLSLSVAGAALSAR